MAVRAKLIRRLGCFLEIERGADAVFVRKAIDAAGFQSVRFSRRMRVTHLEIKSIWDYYRKQFIYGGSLGVYSRIVEARSLNMAERLQVFRAVRTKRADPRGAVFLNLLFLAMGAACYEAGKRKRFIRR